MATYVFIDESGDSGFKIDKGSSDFFVIALLIFKDNLEIEKASLAVKELRRDLKFPDNMEFKFSKSKDVVKEKFLKTIRGFDFKIRALVVEKKIIRSRDLKVDKKSFYSYFVKQVLKYGGKTILNTKVKIDGSGDREFKRSFSSYLRRELNNKEKCILSDLKFVDSKSSIPIQMADMVAGAIRKFYEGDISFKNLIKKLIEDEWKFK
ncbi:MAG: DUF3800 domain-containing protein [bacterium]